MFSSSQLSIVTRIYDIICCRMALIEALYPLQEICRFKKTLDTDIIDRLNHKQTVLVFAILSVVVTAKQYTGEPVHCWVPAEFSPEWTDYTNKICWISNTYYVPIDEDIPSTDENKSERIAYYQWVPLVLMLQAAMFLAPSILWSKLNTRSGIQFSDINSRLITAERLSHDARSKTYTYIVRNIERALSAQKEYRHGWCVKCRQDVTAVCCCLCCGRRYGNYLVSLYLCVKLLYVANSVGQLFLLNEFLGDRYHLYGYKVVADFINGNRWTTSSRFPRVALCDFSIRTLGNRIHNYTVQCTLAMNLFNEMVYIFVWFWLIFVTLATVASFIVWMWTLFLHNRHEYIRKHLKIMERNMKVQSEEGFTPTKRFSYSYLGQDGAFILRIIALNTNDVVVGGIVHKLWERYSKREKEELIKDLDDV